jgi:hypothetical protein
MKKKIDDKNVIDKKVSLNKEQIRPLVGLYSILIEADKRKNPHLYKSQVNKK